MRHAVLACLALAVVWITSGCSARNPPESYSHPKVCVQDADWLEPRCFSVVRLELVRQGGYLMLAPVWEEMTGRGMEPDRPEESPEPENTLAPAPVWQATPY